MLSKLMCLWTITTSVIHVDAFEWDTQVFGNLFKCVPVLHFSPLINAFCVLTIVARSSDGDFCFWPLRAFCGPNSRVKIVSWHQTKVLLDSYKLLSGQCFIFFEGEIEFVEYSVKPFLYNEIAVE